MHHWSHSHTMCSACVVVQYMLSKDHIKPLMVKQSPTPQMAIYMHMPCLSHITIYAIGAVTSSGEACPQLHHSQ